MTQTSSAVDLTLADRWFGVSMTGLKKPAFEMAATQWLQPAKTKEALEAGGAMSKAVDMRLPASFAGLSVLNLMLVKLLVLARDGKWLNLSLACLTLQMEERDGCMHTSYRLTACETIDLPTDEGRRADWLTTRWRDDVTQQIAPVIRCIAEQAGVKPELIWHQAGGRLAGIREFLSRNASEFGADMPARFDAHASILTDRLMPIDFGLRRNPFVWTPKYTDNPWQPGERMLMRSACCMYDCREDGQKCYNCPRLTEKERDQRRQEVLAGANR